MYVDDEEPVVAVTAKGQAVGHAHGPIVVVSRFEDREIDAGDVSGFRRIGEVEDVEPAPGADQLRVILGRVGKIVDFALLIPRKQLGRAVMARIVSCRAVEIAPVDFKAVPEAAELKRADLAERAHVMRVEYCDASGSPFSRVPTSFLALTARIGAAYALAGKGDRAGAVARLEAEKKSLASDEAATALVDSALETVKRWEKRAVRSLFDAADAAAKQLEKADAAKTDVQKTDAPKAETPPAADAAK